MTTRALQPTPGDAPAAPPVPASPEDRARLSGPGLRTFLNIADIWELTEKERITLLGEPGRSTYHQWARKARRGEAITLPFDTLMRISALLGIHKGLGILFSDPKQALTWLNGQHDGTVFRGAAPRAFMLQGAQDGIMTVRRYLDAWRGGAPGLGVTGAPFEPVGPDDLIVI